MNRAVLGVLAISILWVDSLAAQGGATSGGSQQQTVEEIVVRARKRDEFLEDTPVSVTALGATQLRQGGVTRIDQVQQLVPNLVFNPALTGIDAEIKIRGVGTSAIDGIFDPGVGVYLDGVLLPRTDSQFFDLVDIAQIEVLRGPQGTLFGKNTVGGALLVTTVKPHEEFEGAAWVRAGNYDSVQTRASLNIPITERVLSRFAFGSSNTTGYESNTTLGRRYSDNDGLSFIGQLRLLPVDEITIDITGTWSRMSGNGPGPQCAVAQEAGVGNLVEGFYPACRRSQPFKFEADTLGFQRSESAGAWAIGTWHIGEVGFLDSLSVKGIGAWRVDDSASRFDLDGTAFDLLALSAVGGGDTDGDPFSSDAYQVEGQVNATALDERLSIVSGIFSLWESQTARTVLTLLPDQLESITSQNQNFENWNWAVYTQATLDLTDWLSFSAGLRYTEEDKSADVATEELGAGAEPGEPVSNSIKFSRWTPMANVTLRAPEWILDELEILDHAMAYFTFSRGFKGGGFNVAVGASGDSLESFAPETLDSFEIGVKTIGFDERLTLNAALFFARYDDIQVTTVRVTDPDSTDPTNFERITLNAAEATTQGFELEALALPLPGLLVRGSAGLTDATYDEFLGPSAFNNDLVDREGQSLNGVPKWQTQLTLQYSQPVDFPGPTWLAGAITPRLEWYYQSSVHWDFVELMEATQPAYHQINARISYDFNDDRSQIAVWGRNLTDETYFVATQSLANVSGTVTRYHAPPATFGIELSHTFR